MTDPRAQAAQAHMSAAFSRAVDLSSLQAPPGPSRSAAGGDANAPNGGAGDHGSPFIVNATDQTFEQVLQLSMRIPVVVDLWATWCEPCKQLSPVLEKLAAEGQGTWLLAKVDVDANQGIAQAFQVQSIPTVVAIAQGKPVSAFSGAQPEAQIRGWITSLIDQLRETLPGIKEAEDAAGKAEREPEPEDPRLAAAREASDRGDHAAAAAAYRDILESEPDNAEAAAGLAWSELLARAAAAPPDATTRADAAPADVPTVIAAADAEVADGRAADGFARLIKAVSLTANEERSKARHHLLGLFELFPADDATVSAARKALTAALF